MHSEYAVHGEANTEKFGRGNSQNATANPFMEF
jgi:hypothetical protein